MRFITVLHRYSGPALALAVWLTLAGCGTVPEPPPDESERLDVVAWVPIMAAQVEFSRPAGVAAVSVVPLRPGLLVRAATDGDLIRVAWVAETSEAGPQVRLLVQGPAGGDDAPAIEAARAFVDGAGDDLGPGVLSLRVTQAAEVPDAPLVAEAFGHSVLGTPALLASFADHPLGDLDGNGTLDVRDALVLLDHLRTGGWTDFALYHGDLDANEISDVTDVLFLLDKLIDPSMPAALHVKPREVSFVQLDPATDRDAIVLIANQGRLPLTHLAWAPPEGVSVALATGIDGQSAALRLALPEPARRGWRPGSLRVGAAGGETAVRVGHLVVLIGGQSNASGQGAPLAGWPDTENDRVRMFGNDYMWRNASEPLDDADGQVDEVSLDASTRYSLGTRLGGLLHDASGFVTYLIPTAHGGSMVSRWLPGADALDQSTLFGSANYRAQVSAAMQTNPVTVKQYPSEGGPVNVVVWYQGESDESASERAAFVDKTHQVVNAFAAELGVPIVYVQLGTNCLLRNHLQQHEVGELQRRMETGSGHADAVPGFHPGFHMVPAFDLPRSDCIHLSAYGLRILAERIDLAIRQHVLSEDVDGTGPRILGLGRVGYRVTVRTTHELADDVLDPDLFTVFDGPPVGSVDDPASYGTNTLPITAVVRDPGDSNAVRITLGSLPGPGEAHVRYMGSPGLLPCCSNTVPTHSEVWEIVADGTVRAADGGLPLPAFGPLPAFTVP